MRAERTFPVMIGEAIPSALGADEIRVFPFQPWAIAARFEYPAAARDFLSRCGSAAEAFFVRPFTLRENVEYPLGNGTIAIAGDVVLELQARCGGYRIDAVVSDLHSSLALEIDGLAFHHRTREQVAADYLRQRRIVLKGHTVVRFTSREAFETPEECWRQIDAILAARRKN